jgi:hypothetical protein
VSGVAQLTLAWVLAVSEAESAPLLALDAPHAVNAARLAPMVVAIQNCFLLVAVFMSVTFFCLRDSVSRTIRRRIASELMQLGCNEMQGSAPERLFEVTFG